MSELTRIHKVIQDAGDTEKGIFLQRFFKTAEGQYGYGDIFLGLSVPQSRAIAKQFQTLPLTDVISLLHSKFHEERLIALVILTMQYKKGTEKEKKAMYDLYLANTKYINNWDLVDLSAEYIVGEFLYSSSKRSESRSNSSPRASLGRTINTLEKLAKSESLWERRIAILSTFAWIKKGESEPTFIIADILLHDQEDLIHKAVGWLLREVGKRVSQEQEEAFLKTRYKTMPRTMLRYAIERFPEEKRKKYLQGKI